MNKWIEQIKAEALEKYQETLPEGSTGYSSRIQRVNDYMAGAQAALAKVKEIVEKAGDEKFFFDGRFDAGRESLREEILEKLKD